MLEKLVRQIQIGGTLETGDLAARLGASPQLVQAMLEHLQRTGLIRQYMNCDDRGCQGCGLRSSCSGSASVRLWQAGSDD